MPQSTTIEQAYLILIKFLMRSKRRVFELGAEYEVSGMQAIMLLQLDQPRPMNSFQKMFNCDASNVTGLVDGLEQKNLVCRYANQDDRRLKMVKLEARGQKIRTDLVARLVGQGNPLSRLSPSELDMFISLLNKTSETGKH